MKVLLAVAVLIATVYGQACPNPNCGVILPVTPLLGPSLAIPYILVGIDAAANGPCNQSNPNQVSFAEAVIWDPTANALSTYHPLIIDQGSVPLVTPTAPTLPNGATVGIWFGSNANTLTLMDNHNGADLSAGQCINGLTVNGVVNVFGQFSYCNAVTFFALTNAALASGALVAPPLGTAIDGLPCPTVRDFSHVDMDPSDNVVTTYLVSATNGRVAQNTTNNLLALGIQNVIFQTNPSDNRLIVAMDAAYNCNPWIIRSLDDVPAPATGAGPVYVATQATNELHAQAHQAAPIAYIPLGDPMVKVNNQPTLAKVNQYRMGLGQPAAATVTEADTTSFCLNFYQIHPKRLMTNFRTLINFASPAPTVADSLFTFMAQRFFQAFGINNLNCVSLLGVPNPVNLTANGNGLIVGAIIIPPVSTTPSLATSNVVTTPIVTKAAGSALSVNSLFVLALLVVALMTRF